MQTIALIYDLVLSVYWMKTTLTSSPAEDSLCATENLYATIVKIGTIEVGKTMLRQWSSSHYRAVGQNINTSFGLRLRRKCDGTRRRLRTISVSHLLNRIKR